MSAYGPRRFGLVMLLLLSTAGCSQRAGDEIPGSAQANAEEISPADAKPADLEADFGQPADLPLPSTMDVLNYERELFSFLEDRHYVDLGWRRDKTVRDTGPYIDGVYYGTHPAVRVFYSPGIMRWLIGGRVGKIPDGEMIIKEQYAPPAVQHQQKSEEELRQSLESWTVMVKDSRGSHDGWFWSNPGADAKPFNYHAKNEQPYSGFGLYCIRCHASTQSPGVKKPDDPANEYVFAALRNIEGFPGEPILFRVDDSWRKPAKTGDEGSMESTEPITKNPAAEPNSEFLALYDEIAAEDHSDNNRLTPSSYDSVPAKRGEPGFVTSDQCMSCHAGLTGPFGPVGFVHTGEGKAYGDPGLNVSPYGEWRWTPMGLAGRDPVFHAQLESEQAMIRNQFGSGPEANELFETLADTCLRCHGTMGHSHVHQADENAKISLADLHSKTEVGALAREGVSCMICHRMQPPAQDPNDERSELVHYLQTATTGNLHLGPPGEVYGPYKNDELAPYAMHHAMGVEPKHNEYIRQSRMCGTCHTVSLPAIDHPLGEGEITANQKELQAGESVPLFRQYHHHLEQATYLEWLNSRFNNETNPSSPAGQSCQDCHMSDRTFEDEVGPHAGPISTRIAAIHDDTYPDAENLTRHSNLHIRLRDKYRRHHFAGLNAWLVEFFKQKSDVLGIKTSDYMTGSDQGAEQALANIVRTARRQTAKVELSIEPIAEDGENVIQAAVRVTNLAGHRFPTGVAFRRAFIEFSVIEQFSDGNERVVWSSGRTNSLGVIVDRHGRPLASEFFQGQAFQPHHELIDSEDQVQIYETLLADSTGTITTSFVRGCETIKDNRLLPEGWTAEGPGGGLEGVYLKATHPGEETKSDRDFTGGSDVTRYRIVVPSGIEAERLKVKATLFYQALPPYYLKKLFTTAPEGAAAKRLHAIAGGLKLDDSPIRDWKLEIASDESVLSR